MDRMWTCLDFSLHALGTQVVPGGFRRGAGSCWRRCQYMNLESAHLHGEHVNLSERWKLYDEGHCKFKESTGCPSLCRKRHIIIVITVWFIPCIMHRADASHLLLFPSCRNNTVNTFSCTFFNDKMVENRSIQYKLPGKLRLRWRCRNVHTQKPVCHYKFHV